MVERAARAAYIAYSRDDPDAEDFYWCGKDEGEPFDWRKEADRTSVGAAGFLRCARAAIAAMREPTKAMLSVGDDISGTLAITHDSNAALCWQAMIDEALK